MAHRNEPLDILPDWSKESRWAGIKRPYTPADVLRLRGSLQIEYTLARVGAERLWTLLRNEPYVAALSALTGNQAIEQVRAGLKAIYASGWQAAADANTGRDMYPDPNLFPSESVPNLVHNINKALQRADQIHHAEGHNDTRWFVPLVADAESGFGGSLNAFEIMKTMIEAGAAGVQFKDQLFSPKSCGQLQGEVVVPTQSFIQKLIAARLAADVMGVPTLIMARTDACCARYLENDSDAHDHEFMTGERRSDGFFGFSGGLDAAIARGLAYAPYADLLLCETTRPDLREARKFAEAIHSEFPGKVLAYNCSPPFNWAKQLDPATIRNFQVALSGMGFRFQFVALAGFQSLNQGMFELARGYRESGMAALTRLQQAELELAQLSGYEAIKPQRFVGAGYFDDVEQTIAGVSTSAASKVRLTDEERRALAQWASVPSKTAN